MVLLQTSPESPEIFRLIHRINLGEPTADLKKAALAAGVSEEDFQAFLVYGSGKMKGSYDTNICISLSFQKLHKH